MRPVASAVFLLLLPAAALGALGPRHGGALEVGVADLRADLASGYARGAGTRLLRALVHETLLRVGPEGRPEPSLASSWRRGEEGFVWVVDLDEGARFDDGRMLSAVDAVRSLRLFLRSRSPSAGLLAEQLQGGRAFVAAVTDDLPGLDVAGGRSLVLRLVRASADLPLDLGSPSASITAEDGEGMGPFRLLHAIRSERIRLVASGSHVRGRPLLDEIDLRLLSDPSLLSRAFESGRLDLALGLPDARILVPSALLLLRVETGSGPFQSFGERLRLEASLDRTTLAERFIPGGRARCTLALRDEASDAGCPSATSPLPAPPAPPASSARRPLRVAVDLGVPPATSRRLVAHLLSLGFDPSVVVSPPDGESPAADLRVLLFVPEGPDSVAGLVEAAGLVGRGGEMAERLAPLRTGGDPAATRQALEAAEHELLAARTLVPLATMPVLSWRPRVRGLAFGFGRLVVLEDAWVPL